LSWWGVVQEVIKSRINKYTTIKRDNSRESSFVVLITNRDRSIRT
jgi:hypothetical protein